MGVNTKEKILSAAEKLFMENDHEDVSVRRICAVAGVSNGSFYHHIGSKENLIKMIYYSSDEMGIKIFLQKSKNKNIFEKIELIADIYTDFALKYGPKFCKYIIYLKLSDHFIDSETYLLGSQMKLLIKDAYSNNYFNNEYTENFILSVFLTTIRGFAYEWSTQNGEGDLKKYTLSAIKILINQFKNI